jgi:hypothetical protein
MKRMGTMMGGRRKDDRRKKSGDEETDSLGGERQEGQGVAAA